MCLKIRPLILIISILFFSCKKSDVILRTDSDNGGTGSGDIAYNVNESVLLKLVNDVRTSGCTCGTTTMPSVGSLAWSDQLAKAAYDHSNDMKTNNYFSHSGLDGSDPGQRITAAGYSWESWGENIANGYTTEQSVMDAWLGSEGHCKNLMNAGFKDMGAGRSGNLWTQDFGSK